MIYAFGDESISSATVVYATAVFADDQVPRAEEIVASAKRSLGLDPEVPLHCREIFSGDARRGTPWADVEADDIRSMVKALCEQLKPVQYQPVVAAIDPRHVPPQPVAPGQPNRPLVEKAIATLAYNVVATMLRLRFGQGNFRLWIDPDSTMIPWGPGNRQVNSTRDLYLDLVPGMPPTLLVPEIEATPKPRLLEIADLYAYVTRKAFSGPYGRYDRWFHALYAEINPEAHVLNSWNPDPQWVGPNT